MNWFVQLSAQQPFMAMGVLLVTVVFIVCFFSWMPGDADAMKWKLRYQEHMNAFHPDVELAEDDDEHS